MCGLVLFMGLLKFGRERNEGFCGFQLALLYTIPVH